MKKLLLLLSCVLICLLLGGCGNPKKEAAGLYDKYYGENGSVVKLAMDMYRKSTKSGITAFEMRQIRRAGKIRTRPCCTCIKGSSACVSSLNRL